MHVVAAVEFLFLGVFCIIFGVNLRKGRGEAKMRKGRGKEWLSRSVRVSYAQVPYTVRLPASNANLVMGSGWLALGLCALFPSALFLVPMAFLLLSVYPYYSRHRDLHAAAKKAWKQGQSTDAALRTCRTGGNTDANSEDRDLKQK